MNLARAETVNLYKKQIMRSGEHADATEQVALREWPLGIVEDG